MMLEILQQALYDTVSTMATVFIMLFITGFLVELNAFQRVSYLARPLIRISNLPAESASTFVVSLGSALAANTMIARMKDEGVLSERQAFLSAIMNSVPVYFRELFTYQLAFVIPVLGIFVGGVYAFISIATGLVKLLLVLVLGRTYLKSGSSASFGKSSSGVASSERASTAENVSSSQELQNGKGSLFGRDLSSAGASEEHPSKAELYKKAAINSLLGQRRMFLRIAGLYFIMTFLVLYLSEEGILQSLDVLTFAQFFSIPPETVIPLTVYVASPKAGITLLGPLIHSGGITETKALIVLMVGSLFMLPFYSLRSLLPNYTSVFGMRIGLILVIISTGISVLVRVSVLLILLLASG